MCPGAESEAGSLAVYDGTLGDSVSGQAPETGCPAGPGVAGGGEALSAVGLSLSRGLSAGPRVARQSQACAPSLAAVRLAGSSAEAAEENSDRGDAPADGPDQKRSVELGFRARCDHGWPRVSLSDREG